MIVAGFPFLACELLAEADRPTGGAKQPAPPAAKKANRFLLHYPLDGFVFRNVAKSPGDPWRTGSRAGTVSQQIAEVTATLGTTGAIVPGIKIVKLTAPNGTVTVDVQFPTSGGQARVAYLDTRHDSLLNDEFEDFKKLVREKYYDFRRREKANGATSISSAPMTSGDVMSKDMLAELGID